MIVSNGRDFLPVLFLPFRKAGPFMRVNSLPRSVLLAKFSLLAIAPFVTTVFSAVSVSGADSDPTPRAVKGKLVFSDDFQRTELGSAWKVGIPGYQISDGVLRGIQAKSDHGSSVGTSLPLPSGDFHLELRFRFEGAKSININLDDKAFKGVHAGHISRVVIRPPTLILMDDKEGVMRNDIRALRKSNDPEMKAEGDRMSAGATKKVPVKIRPGQWYKLNVEIVGDRMRVMIDDQRVGSLQSPGLAHPTKPDLRI